MNLTGLKWRYLSVCSHMLVASLLVGGSSLAQIATDRSLPAIAQASDGSKTEPLARDPIVQKLIGKWQTIRPPAAEVESATFAFAPDGKLTMLMAGASGELGVVQMGYQINPNTQPIHLNLILSNRSDEIVRTILGFTQEGLLRMQISGIDPTTPRPSSFTADEPLLRKISTIPSLQPDLQAVTRQIAGRTRESEGKLYVSSLIQAEMAYFLANGKYGRAIDQLGTGFQPETENYRYEIVSDADTQWVGVRGLAKRLGLKSFVGIVFTVTEKTGPFVLMAKVCQSKEPTRLPPRFPDLVATDSGAEPRIRCGEETQPI